VEVLLAVVVGGLYAAGIYLMLRRSIIKVIFGLALLGHAANLLIFTSAGLTRGRAPLVPIGGSVAPAEIADPLPQALILTAIVISFGVVAFAMVLFRRGWEAAGTDDTDAMRTTE
jgi:multicomponent Na+:H+ antiporter subunit C